MLQWIQVLPQIMARIDTPQAEVRGLLLALLVQVAREHPQALVYQLTVCSKSKSRARREAALKVLCDMRQDNPQLVSQAIQISDELIRTAILLVEFWKQGIEEAWQ